MKKLSLCLMLSALMGCANVMDKIKTFNSGDSQAQEATAFFTKGDLRNAQIMANEALEKNPNQVQALLVAALTAEGSANPNQATAYYERIILLNPQELTSLATTDMKPVKVIDVAKKRLRALNIKNSEVIIEDYQGDKVFNIKAQTANKQNKSALEEALFIKEQKDVNYTQANAEANVKAVEVLFDDEEKNKISRFLILKELAENDLITKEEFLSARMTNIGALLPLTNTPPAYGLGKPVPSADIILERIAILKEGLSDRSISSKEYIAERNAIITALMPAKPRLRDGKKAPAKDILAAAKDLRKLEVLSELSLITKSEKQKEIKAIETFLGLNQEPKIIEKVVEIEKIVEVPSPLPSPLPQQEADETVVIDLTKVKEEADSNKSPSTPQVSSPF